MRIRRYFVAVGLVMSVGLAPQSAQALSKDARTVLLATAYGTGAGTVMGVVFWPLSRDWRAIFVGMGVGLVLGAGIGTYHIFHRKDPNNPLARDSDDERSVDQRRYVFEEGERGHWERTHRIREGSPGVRLSFPVAQF